MYKKEGGQLWTVKPPSKTIHDMQDIKKVRELKVQNFLKPKAGENAQSIPQILLKGKWLEQAGFPPNSQIEVITGKGELTIRKKEVCHD